MGAFALSVAFVWPVIVLLVEVVAGLAVVAVRLVLGKWTVVAEAPGERWSWPVRGRARSIALAAEVAGALRTGTGLPGGRSFESVASANLTEADVAKPASTGHVRVLKP